MKKYSVEIFQKHTSMFYQAVLDVAVVPLLAFCEAYALESAVSKPVCKRALCYFSTDYGSH